MAPHSTDLDQSTNPHSTVPSYGFQPSATQKQLSDQKAAPALLHRSLAHQPETVVHASGIKLTLSSGRIIIDACGGAAVSCLGHGNSEVLDAAMQQMRDVSYVHTGAYTTSAAEDLASLILEHGRQYGLEKAFFCGSGSEAMDTALKLARQFFYETGEKQRVNLVAREQSWHGATIGSMSVGSNLPRKIPYEPLLLQNVSHVSPAFAYHYQYASESEEDFVKRLAIELEDEFQRLGPETVIAFIAEPIVGATTGCVPAPAGYFKAVHQICDKYGILLILDEVMCGMGRCGTLFAFEQEDVVPDIMTMGKGLGGGYAPIASVVVSKKVVDGLRVGTGMFNHGHTYQAHPLSCATALVVQKIIKRDGLVERCSIMGASLEKLLRKKLACENNKYIGNIRGRGLFWGIEFVADQATRMPFDPSLEFGLRVQKKAFEFGVAIYPGAATVDGATGDHVLIAPPYIVSNNELENIVEIVAKAYKAVENEIL
ncbi:hypothetical protein ACLMJK_002427 [Lecanora helva]